MITDQMKAEGSLWDVTQDLLSRFSKASKKGTGLRLSADDVFILSLTGFGQQFLEPDPRKPEGTSHD